MISKNFYDFLVDTNEFFMIVVLLIVMINCLGYGARVRRCRCAS